MRIITTIIVAFLFIYYLSGCKVKGQEIFYIPHNYQGIIVVYFNCLDGKPVKYEDGCRIYEIDTNGILRTQFEDNEGHSIESKYYYVLDDKTRVKIPYNSDMPFSDINIGSDDVYAFSRRYEVGVNTKENKKYSCINLIIAKYKNADSIFQLRELGLPHS